MMATASAIFSLWDTKNERSCSIVLWQMFLAALHVFKWCAGAVSVILRCSSSTWQVYPCPALCQYMRSPCCSYVKGVCCTFACDLFSLCQLCWVREAGFNVALMFSWFACLAWFCVGILVSSTLLGRNPAPKRLLLHLSADLQWISSLANCYQNICTLCIFTCRF